MKSASVSLSPGAFAEPDAGFGVKLTNTMAFRAAWLRLKETDLIPDKGQFR